MDGKKHSAGYQRSRLKRPSSTSFSRSRFERVGGDNYDKDERTHRLLRRTGDLEKEVKKGASGEISGTRLNVFPSMRRPIREVAVI